MKNPVKSVGMKLFLTFFVSILVFVFVVGMTSYLISKSVIANKMSEASQQTIAQAGQKLDFLFQSYEDSSFQITMDKDLLDLLEKLNITNPASEEYKNSMLKVTEKLNVSLLNNSIRAIHLYKPTGEVIKVIGSRAGGELSQSAAEFEWFKRIVSNNGMATWLETKVKGYSGFSDAFGVGRVMKSLTSNQPVAVMLLEINGLVLRNETDAIKLGEDSEIVISSENNKYVFNKQLDLLEQDASFKLTKEQQEQGSGSMENNGQLIVYYKSYVTKWNLVGSMSVSSLVKDAKKIFDLTIATAIVAALIAVLIGWFVARMIGRPLAGLSNLMEQGAQGNLTVRANFSSKDEIGRLGASFDVMMQQITALVKQTNQSAQDVLDTSAELSNASKTTATSAREIAVATDEISGGAAGLATESEKGNELTQHIGQQMKTVIEANLEMGTSAADVQSSSELGTKYMAELIGKTNLTEEMMRSMVDKVDKLKESTRSIRKILEVLNNLTKQTNILSLNATIEAARAGAAGKGFMVVADEIRKLADQSRQSIDVVGQITETIQREIDETVGVLSKATPIFQEQIQAVKEADTIFKQVTTHMGGFIVQLSAVSDSISTLEQSQIILSDAMTNVSAVAQESLATSEEVASLSAEQLNVSDGLVKLSDKLDQLSNSLKDSLSKFQV